MTKMIPTSAPELSDIVARIWNEDPSLFGTNPTEYRAIASRFGWTSVAEKMVGQTRSLRDLREQLRREGRTKALLLGIGGSSLAADVLRQSFSNATDALNLSVLDSTHPEAVRQIARTHDLQETICIVASKSGTTTEARCLQQEFWKLATQVTTRPGDGFIAITDPGSVLAEIGARDGYRRVFLNPPDIGGRYSALSFFGLVPGALCGADIDSLLERAQLAMTACRQTDQLDLNHGAQLGRFLGDQARGGRNKLTLICDEPFSSFGIWVEQLIAESLGKNGGGILPIEGDQLRHADGYASDQLFVALDTRSSTPPGFHLGAGGLSAELSEIESRGHPVARLGAHDASDLGSLFFFWEFATTVCGAILSIEPFDQPDVESAKVQTRSILSDARGTGTIASPVGLTGLAAVDAILDAARSQVPASYIALQAYVAPTARTTDALHILRSELSRATRCPVTIGIGPRFLHSTGQLHKGGIAGLSVQLIDQTVEDTVPISGEWFSFGQLIAAQSLGDQSALQARQRQTIRVDLRTTASDAITELTSLIAARS